MKQVKRGRWARKLEGTLWQMCALRKAVFCIESDGAVT
jgi:hypothetical protein